MPRPTRIEYENAFYHVMNRGRARNNIYFKEDHYLIFIKVLKESCERFDCVIHSYCLMPNHYHLLIQTPHANLSRVMGHINSLYTKKFNKIQKIDGPLFRGRYKALLVEEDEYLLELSKYIHRNPIQTKNKQNRLVNDLKDYQWSSYPSYLDISVTPKWLNKELTFSKFKSDQDLIKRYQLFVEGEENKELEEFFNKKNQEIIIGRKGFKEKILINQLINQREKQDKIKREIKNQLTAEEIITAVAKVFDVTKESIVYKQSGKLRKNIPRSISMYLTQEIKDCSLREISKIFNLKNINSSTFALSEIRKCLKKGYHENEVSNIKRSLGIST